MPEAATNVSGASSADALAGGRRRPDHATLLLVDHGFCIS